MSSDKPSSAGFEPPKYLASLIAAVNDGAKAAQGGLLLYMLVGLYLMATAFSSTDEDLLLGKAVTIAQIGASLPVSFSFAIAPLVFVFLHVYTLTRFDMLAANLRHFVSVLRRDVRRQSERENCRHLLSNVEFVLALVAEPGSTLYSPFWRRMVRALLAVFPITVLLLVQINALRYQSQPIRWVQFAWLVVDLAALIWFFRRNALGTISPPSRWPVIAWWTASPRLPALVLAVNLLYLNVVPEDADPRVVRGEQFNLFDVARQPLDTLVCPRLGWGCRYLRVENRTLVGHVWDEKVMVGLNGAKPDFAALLPGIEGVELPGRSLRFAVFPGVRMFKADLGGAQLTGANLRRAQLAGANLGGAQLAGADLGRAQLAGANLCRAQLPSVDLCGAQLAGANLIGAQLAGANLPWAQLAGADLGGAQLAGANLGGAQLAGANLRNARLTNIVSSDETTFASADFRGVDFAAFPTGKERDEIRAALASIPEGEQRKIAEARLEPVLSGTKQTGWELHFTASDQEKLLVSSRDDPLFAAHRAWLTDVADDAWRSALALRLAADLAKEDQAAAAAVAERAADEMAFGPDSDAQLRGEAIACRFLAEAGATPPRLTLDQTTRDRLKTALDQARLTCPMPPAKPSP